MLWRDSSSLPWRSSPEKENSIFCKQESVTRQPVELLQSRLRRVFPKPTLHYQFDHHLWSPHFLLMIVVFPKIDICIWSVRCSSRRSKLKPSMKLHLITWLEPHTHTTHIPMTTSTPFPPRPFSVSLSFLTLLYYTAHP